MIVNFLRRTMPVLALGTFAFANEGMWTFDNPPLRQLREQFNFTPTQQWLDHIRLSSVRLNDGGSGSFVSAQGLLLTNHHVARGQLQKASTAQRDYIKDGFYAKAQAEEMKTPDLEVNVLLSMEDVTARVQTALKGAKNAVAEFTARKTVLAAIEKESLDKTGLRSDIVTLYQGGEYWLYRYKKYTDVRLVFAPEQQIAFFGGDADNFTFPRYDIDMALFRVYENDKPVDTSKTFLKWNPKGSAENDLVFVSGHPGSTQRMDTMAQLTYERDVLEPMLIRLLARRIDTLNKYSRTSPEAARQASSRIFGLANSLKAYQGRYDGLKDPAVMGAKQKDESAFRAGIKANGEWQRQFGDAWDSIAEAMKKASTRSGETYFHGLDSDLNTLAVQIVQYVTEVRKPDGDRLPGFHESQLESLRFELLSPAPVYPDMEIARMTGQLTMDLEERGQNDAFLKTVLNGRTPADTAAALIRGTKMGDAAFRKSLIEGGEAAVKASTDPLIALARTLDPLRRELIKWQQDNIQSVEQTAGEKIGKARFAAYGKTTNPDATFTLRLSYGQVKGYPMNGTKAPSKTTLYGLYDRAASFNYEGDFALPSRYMENRFKDNNEKLDLSTAVNFVTTNDIIGGNSGSPVIDRNGDLVGLIFDGNIESLVGDFVYNPERNRAVAVHTAVMTEVMKKLYGAQALLDEMMAK